MYFRNLNILKEKLIAYFRLKKGIWGFRIIKIRRVAYGNIKKCLKGENQLLLLSFMLLVITIIIEFYCRLLAIKTKSYFYLIPLIVMISYREILLFNYRKDSTKGLQYNKNFISCVLKKIVKTSLIKPPSHLIMFLLNTLTGVPFRAEECSYLSKTRFNNSSERIKVIKIHQFFKSFIFISRKLLPSLFTTLNMSLFYVIQFFYFSYFLCLFERQNLSQGKEVLSYFSFMKKQFRSSSFNASYSGDRKNIDNSFETQGSVLFALFLGSLLAGRVNIFKIGPRSFYDFEAQLNHRKEETSTYYRNTKLTNELHVVTEYIKTKPLLLYRDSSKKEEYFEQEINIDDITLELPFRILLGSPHASSRNYFLKLLSRAARRDISGLIAKVKREELITDKPYYLNSITRKIDLVEQDSLEKNIYFSRVVFENLLLKKILKEILLCEKKGKLIPAYEA